ncbi:acetoin utilization deacetylase AcuC-like enzyme [Aliiruegeria haliotis]|uniref:Acetoin utilization deacetylase AcuC-like enzyme n=1 Tax=Aliiruegeria haliotis TaxID=1280846 RepID=A0A2T0RTH5_9RHOB|nr:histone deacetylase family protein [Aliiruegeria haliotis]PRY24484.1 acetoin utilization deacetylase AcuC-like enzyme [Aliiruegeria haliotis]
MSTALFTHPSCLGHETPPGHPECADRLRVILAALDDPAFGALDRRVAPLGEREDVLRVHPEAHVAAIEAAVPADGWVSLDADTHVMAKSLDAAWRGVGAVTAAVDAVVAGEVRNAFCAIRPPGHHAETSTPMGFCLFGNISIAAKRALDHHGLSRVAIVDFDVHHGNGTQDLLWNEARVLFASTHQMPLYPGSGERHETGAHDNIMNVPLPPSADGAAFRTAMEGLVLPALEDFRPELVLISAGFDAHSSDPLAQLNLEVEDFVWATRALCELADRHCGGRVVSTLEGGYDLEALAASVAAHVKVLMEQGG